MESLGVVLLGFSFLALALVGLMVADVISERTYVLKQTRKGASSSHASSH